MTEQNPHDLPAPEEPVERAIAFARDLAYGAVNKMWTTRIRFGFSKENDALWQPFTVYLDEDENNPFDTLISEKYENRLPSHELMIGMGFIHRLHDTYGQMVSQGTLTADAFHTLAEPDLSPVIFISHEPGEADKLLEAVEAALDDLDDPDLFIYRNEFNDAELDDRVREAIIESSYFVCILGSNTLKSGIILQEIATADDCGCVMISLWDGVQPDADCPVALREGEIILVKDQNSDYADAIEALLNALEY